jgi:hypothetical protein
VGKSLTIDPKDLISIIISIVAAIIAFSSMLYTKRRAKIMEEELKIMKRGKEREMAFERASEVVRAVRSETEETLKDIRCKISTYPYFYAIRDDIVRFIFDEKKEELNLEFNPIRFDLGSVETGRNWSFVETDSYNVFENELSKILVGDFHPIAWLYYECLPRISPEPYGIDFSDLFNLLKKAYQSIRKLAPYKDQIDVFDSGVSNEMHRNLMNICRSVYECAMKSHRIEINEGNKSEDVKNRLLENILGLKSIDRNLDLLAEGTQKLSRVQEELFRASK